MQHDDHHEQIHVHLHWSDEQLQRLAAIVSGGEHLHHALAKILEKVNLMATKQEVLDSIKAEAAEVATRINELGAQITDLQAQVAAGTATPQDWQDVKDAVEAIFTPTVQTPPQPPVG